MSEEAVKYVFVYITPKVMEIKEETKWDIKNVLSSYGGDRHKSIEPDHNLKALADGQFQLLYFDSFAGCTRGVSDYLVTGSYREYSLLCFPPLCVLSCDMSTVTSKASIPQRAIYW